MKARRLTATLLAMTMLGVLFLASGCENEQYGHRPPPGQGSLIVDNLTGARLDVFVDGALVGDVRAWRDRAWDLPPGVHRLALRERDDRRYFGGDTDIVADRRTIAQVHLRPDGAGLQIVFLMD